jgi:hypothetical protein
VLVDPAISGDAARLGRWEFTASETAAMLAGGPDRGIHLQLPWPASPPAHGKLQLFVRYATRDGRKLQVNRPIEIALPGERPASWTPAERGPALQPAAAPADSWRSAPAETSNRPEAEPARAASPSDEPVSRRPAWSPDRRY